MYGQVHRSLEDAFWLPSPAGRCSGGRAHVLGVDPAEPIRVAIAPAPAQRTPTSPALPMASPSRNRRGAGTDRAPREPDEAVELSPHHQSPDHRRTVPQRNRPDGHAKGDHAEDRRLGAPGGDEILSATWRVIARDGIARATIRAIAREAGCSRGHPGALFRRQSRHPGSAVMSDRRVVARMQAGGRARPARAVPHVIMLEDLELVLPARPRGPDRDQLLGAGARQLARPRQHRAKFHRLHRPAARASRRRRKGLASPPAPAWMSQPALDQPLV